MPMINDVISAYRNTAASLGGSSPETAAGGGGPSFGSMVKGAIQDAVDAGKKSEAAAHSAIVGKSADPTTVAQAVNNADITLQTVIAVRDKVVSAYQNILQMPI